MHIIEWNWVLYMVWKMDSTTIGKFRPSATEQEYKYLDFSTHYNRYCVLDTTLEIVKLYRFPPSPAPQTMFLSMSV